MGNLVLLVDDDPTLLRFLGEYLEQAGFSVNTADNGPTALRLAYRIQPELVVLDVMMPGMDGWEVCARLREMSDVPIILLTAKTAEADKLRGFRLGVDDYVTKPFSFAELSARIQAVIGRARRIHPTGEDNILHFGDILVDTRKREVRRGEDLIALTPTEYRLLEYLCKQQGCSVAEEALTKEIWGDYRQEETTAVRRYIWLLRQKLEVDPAHPRWIVTVRGFGYRLEGVGEEGGVNEPPENDPRL